MSEKSWSVSSNLTSPDGGRGEIARLIRQLKDAPDAGKLEKLARRAVTLRPDNPDLRYVLAYALQVQGKGGEAERQYGEVLRLRPRHVPALVNLGIVQINGGQPAAGLKALDAALHLEPDNTGALMHKGRGLGLLGRPDDALKVYERLTSLTPDDAEAFKALALCQIQVGNNIKAAETLHHAHQLAPDDPEIKAALKKLAA